MKASLRKFENEDTPVLLQLFYDTVHSINAKDYPADLLDVWAPQRPDVKRWQSRFKTSKTIIAELDGKVVGFGTVEDNGKTIGMLYVHKDHQRQGVASELLARLEKKLAKDGAFAATVESSLTARSFFEKKGYSLVRENRKMLNGQAFVNLIMEKDLTLKEEKPMKEKSIEKSKPFKWRDLFFNKVFDLIIVIAGVSIAFQLNNLKLNSDAKSLERFYMEGLVLDVKADIKKAQENLADLKSDFRKAEMIMESLKATDPVVAGDSIGRAFGDIVGFSTLDQHSNTYDLMINGNGLTVIQDRKIRTLVAEYYGNYPGIRRFEDVYTEVIIRTFAFTYSSVDFTVQQVVDESLLKKTETRNFVLMIESQLQDGIEKYTDLIENGQQLLTVLENNLRK
jgi:putative acetyltransferase